MTTETQTKPIYDQPNHPHYGPVRRMHLILMYLFESRTEEYEQGFKTEYGAHWWERLVWSLEGGRTERDAAHHLIWMSMQI